MNMTVKKTNAKGNSEVKYGFKSDPFLHVLFGSIIALYALLLVFIILIFMDLL